LKNNRRDVGIFEIWHMKERKISLISALYHCPNFGYGFGDVAHELYLSTGARNHRPFRHFTEMPRKTARFSKQNLRIFCWCLLLDRIKEDETNINRWWPHAYVQIANSSYFLSKRATLFIFVYGYLALFAADSIQAHVLLVASSFTRMQYLLPRNLTSALHNKLLLPTSKGGSSVSVLLSYRGQALTDLVSTKHRSVNNSRRFAFHS
jgi:hypothetical protein